MDQTTRHYELHSGEFFQTTVAVDMTPLYAAFLAQLKLGSHILDAGCGSGRDAKAFASRGFAVTAFDASAALAKLAAEHCGFPVNVRRFEDVQDLEMYDGIWSCAGLLHVPAAAMADTMARLWRALKVQGCFYASFKLGEGEREHGGRRFTDATEPILREWMATLPGLEIKDLWVSQDQRPEHPEKWLNVIAVKSAQHPRKLVIGGTADPFLPHLSKAMSVATEIAIAVSFVKVLGLKLLMPDLKAALRPQDAECQTPARIRFLTSDYLGVTEPDALRLLPLHHHIVETGNESQRFLHSTGVAKKRIRAREQARNATDAISPLPVTDSPAEAAAPGFARRGCSGLNETRRKRRPGSRLTHSLSLAGGVSPLAHYCVGTAARNSFGADTHANLSALMGDLDGR